MAIVPALKALADYELVAVSTTRMESAKAAAKELGVSFAFDNHQALVNHPGVDVVVVAVRVPHHFELATAAIEAGKHVYCEWPLGNGLVEAEKLAALARKKGIRAVVGLQARSSPVINYIRDLVAEGYVGKVLSTTIIGTGFNGPMTQLPNAYLADVRNGATLLTIPFGHSIDAVLYALRRELRELGAITANQRKSVKIMETGDSIPMTAEDQVAVIGVLDNDAVFSAHYRGDMPREGDVGFLWHIHGSEGDLKMTAISGNIQMFDVVIHGARGENQPMQPLPVPDKYKRIPSADGFAQNVAQALACMANDIRNGTTTCPTFDDAVVRHRMIAAILEAAGSGQRQPLPH
jgi:predicted dehydrogenase